jgi:hypothetical protein
MASMVSRLKPCEENPWKNRPAHAVELPRASGPHWIIKEFAVRLHGGIAAARTIAFRSKARHGREGGMFIRFREAFPLLPLSIIPPAPPP